MLVQQEVSDTDGHDPHIVSSHLDVIPHDDDFLEGIFTPFRKGIKGEFGLGLSIVKKTLNIMGYDIEIVNEKKGVSFIITKGIHK